MLHLCGWKHLPHEVDKYSKQNKTPYFTSSAPLLKDSGKGKTVCLYRATYKVLGQENYPYRLQEIGDCTAESEGQVIDNLKCVQIAIGDIPGEFEGMTCSEVIYGYERINIAQGQMGSEDGGCGAWVCDAVLKLGTVIYGVYDGIDISKYSGQRAKDYGINGVPHQLDKYAHEHLIKATSIVSSWEELRDAIANGYPCQVCSQQGFANVRNKDGTADPQGTWPHAMSILAVDDNPNNPAALISNTWGRTWIKGPQRFGDEPDGSFWVVPEVLNRMLSFGDSHAFSNLEGYPPKKLDLRLF